LAVANSKIDELTAQLKKLGKGPQNVVEENELATQLPCELKCERLNDRLSVLEKDNESLKRGFVNYFNLY
jgi:hypothetical protein